MTGKKTDNRDCAIKNPDKWGAEKSENDNNRIERSVKDDDPAQAGFFLSQELRVQESLLAMNHRVVLGAIALIVLSMHLRASVAESTLSFRGSRRPCHGSRNRNAARRTGTAMMTRMPATQVAGIFICAT